MRRTVRKRPGGQLDWIVFKDHSAYRRRQSSDRKYSLAPRTEGAVRPQSNENSLLYAWELPESARRISGELRFDKQECGELELSVWNDSEDSTSSKEAAQRLNEPGSFEFSIGGRKTTDLLVLNVACVDTAGSPESLFFELDNLVVETRAL
jgi:hypothetical protein